MTSSRTRPAVLVPRRQRFEISERIDAQGEIVTALDEAEIDALVGSIRGLDGESRRSRSASCSRSSTTSHEQRIGERLRAALPGIPVFLSSEILPEIREFERTSTTAVCAYVGPVLTSYLARLEEPPSASSTSRRLHVMGSSGGVLDVAGALRMPAAAVESGPAAGVIAAQRLGDQLGRADPHLLRHGRHHRQGEPHRERPHRDHLGVRGGGAGQRWALAARHRPPDQGSGHRSRGGERRAAAASPGSTRAERSGSAPESAGAEPGPACYGRGGDRPTVTDANVVLGYT